MTQHPVPSRRARELVAGGYDTHVHVAPDVMARRIDDVALARRFAEVGLAGFVEDGLALLADRLLAAGFSEDDVHTMAVVNTRRLVT